MVDKKVVGLDNLKVFYNKLKDIFAPKLEGKNYLTSTTGDEGYTKTEVNIITKNLEDKIKSGTITPGGNSGGTISTDYMDYFDLDNPLSLEEITPTIDKYNYYVQNEDGEFIGASISDYENVANNGDKTEKMFYYNKLLSPATSVYGARKYVQDSLILAMLNHRYTGYNFGEKGLNYPDYFNYYSMTYIPEDNVTTFTSLTPSEAKTKGDKGEQVFIDRMTGLEIETMVKAIVKDMVKSSSLQ